MRRSVRFGSVGAALLLAVVSVPGRQAAAAPIPLVQYQMGQVGPQLQDPVNTAGGGDLTNAMLSTFNVTATNGYASAPVLQVNPPAAEADATAAYAGNSYFSFTITAGSSVSDLDLSSLTFDVARGASSSTRGYGVRVQTPTMTDEIVQPSTTVNAVRSTFETDTIPLSGFASLQNLTPGQTVTFQIAVWTPSTGNSLEFDNITVNGTTPEPAGASLLALGSLTLLRRRKR